MPVEQINVGEVILEEHLNLCVTEAVRGDDAKQREKVLREIADVFEQANGK